MQEQEAKAKKPKPDVTVIDIWRKAATYILLAIIGIFILALVRDVQMQRQGDALFDLAWLVAVCAVFGYYCRRASVVSWHKLERFISTSLQATVNLNHETNRLDKLPKLHGGWINATLLLRHGDTYYLPRLQQLADYPRTDRPVLVFRDHQDALHLFGFGNANIAALPHPTEAGLYKTATYHGIVGPAKFSQRKAAA